MLRRHRLPCQAQGRRLLQIAQERQFPAEPQLPRSTAGLCLRMVTALLPRIGNIDGAEQLFWDLVPTLPLEGQWRSVFEGALRMRTRHAVLSVMDVNLLPADEKALDSLALHLSVHAREVTKVLLQAALLLL